VKKKAARRTVAKKAPKKKKTVKKAAKKKVAKKKIEKKKAPAKARTRSVPAPVAVQEGEPVEVVSHEIISGEVVTIEVIASELVANEQFSSGSTVDEQPGDKAENELNRIDLDLGDPANGALDGDRSMIHAPVDDESIPAEVGSDDAASNELASDIEEEIRLGREFMKKYRETFRALSK